MRTLVAVTCVVAVTAGAAWTTSGSTQPTGSTRSTSIRAAAPALGWRSVRIGTASGFLALPPHPRALAIVIHGGLAANRVRAEVGARVAGRVYAAHLAPLGIGVLSVNYHWSGYGGRELRDVAAALSYSRRAPITARLPVILIGASHGGYLAALAATMPSAKAAHVRAVVDLYGFSNLGATVSSPSSRYDRQARLTMRELGRPARNQAAYAARSPLSRAGLLTAPLLQVVGGRDRATQSDVLALTRAVRMSGGSATLRVIPGSNHGFAFATADSRLAWDEVVSFLRQLRLAS